MQIPKRIYLRRIYNYPPIAYILVSCCALLLYSCRVSPDSSGMSDYAKANGALAENRNEESIRCFEKALKAGYDPALCIYGEASAYANMGEIEQSDSLLDIALQLKPQLETGRTLMITNQVLQGDFSKLKENITWLKEHPAANLITQLNIASLAEQAGKHADAINILNEVIEKYPNISYPYLLRANYNNIKDTASAIKDLDKAIQLSPDNVQAYFLRGRLYYYSHAYTHALSDYQKVEMLDPDYEDLDLYLGSACFMCKDTLSACFYWEKAAESGGNQAKHLVERYCQ